MKYPVLKEYNSVIGNFVVLFLQPECGFVVETVNLFYPLGMYKKDWLEHDFKIFGGTITLRNEG